MANVQFCMFSGLILTTEPFLKGKFLHLSQAVTCPMKGRANMVPKLRQKGQ